MASKYDFLGQNKLKDTQSIVYARVRASSLEELGMYDFDGSIETFQNKKGRWQSKLASQSIVYTACFWLIARWCPVFNFQKDPKAVFT